MRKPGEINLGAPRFVRLIREPVVRSGFQAGIAVDGDGLQHGKRLQTGGQREGLQHGILSRSLLCLLVQEPLAIAAAVRWDNIRVRLDQGSVELRTIRRDIPNFLVPIGIRYSEVNRASV